MLLIAVFAGWFGIYTWLGHRELEAVLSEWDKLGRWRYADLIANQQAEEHNSVPYWVIRQARSLTWINLDDQRHHFQTREYEPNLLLHADSIQYLRNRANGWPTFLEQLKELDALPDKPGVGPLNIHPPWSIYFKYTEETRKVCSVMREQFWLALHEKKVHLAIELLRYEKRLALHHLAEPCLINQLLSGLGGMDVYLRNIQEMLAQGELSEGQLIELSVDLGNYDSRSIWQKLLPAIAGDAFQSLECFGRSENELLKQYRRKEDKTWEKIKQYVNEVRVQSELRSPFFRAEIMRSLLNVRKQRERPLVQIYLEQASRSAALKNVLVDELDARSLATPHVDKSLLSIMKQSAYWRSTQIALAAERFRLQHQRWPQTQDELIPKFLPAVLLDPFDDKPLRLKAVDDGLLIYSVVGSARDREFADDGGDIQKSEVKYLTKDTGVKLWNPAHRRKPAKPLERREEQD